MTALSFPFRGQGEELWLLQFPSGVKMQWGSSL